MDILETALEGGGLDTPAGQRVVAHVVGRLRDVVGGEVEVVDEDWRSLEVSITSVKRPEVLRVMLTLDEGTGVLEALQVDEANEEVEVLHTAVSDLVDLEEALDSLEDASLLQ